MKGNLSVEIESKEEAAKKALFIQIDSSLPPRKLYQ